MRFSRLVAIFRKELVDIVRDRRTLIGMVIIPVALYPVLILTFGPAEVGQVEAIRQEPYTIAVPDESQAEWIERVIQQASDHPATSTASTSGPAAWRGRPKVVLLNGQYGGDPNRAVRGGRAVQIGLTLSGDPRSWGAGLEPVEVRLAFDPRDVRSVEALRRTEDLLGQHAERERVRLRRQLVADLGAPALDSRLRTLLEPVRLDARPVTPGSVFLQMMPVILVLMTVTGAIYPAIDLTAGERERGTLETLMVTPVPTLEVVTGKFLVVTMVALVTALLNVVSIGASIRLIKVEEATHVPVSHLAIVLLAIIPLAMLFAAALIAVCSFARSYKEAQNYVMPVVIAAIVPAIMGTLPGATLAGAAKVIPVENIVLLAHELVTRDSVPWADVVAVLLSTGLYAAGAIAVASRLFGHEAVTFADAGSYRALFRRRFFRPTARPTAAQALLTLAILFPIWFHVQGVIATGTRSASAGSFVWVILLMVPVLAVPPIGLAWYLKIDLRTTFSLRAGTVRGWLAALLLGCSTWAVAIEFQSLQESVLPVPPALREGLAATDQAIGGLPTVAALICVGLIPALCEEVLFRGYLLAGLRSQLRKTSAILGVALIFALYHALVYRFAVTALLGIMLAWLCWESRSILPAIFVHAMHNGSVVLIGRSEALQRWLRLSDFGGGHLPMHIWIPTVVCVVLAIVILAFGGRRASEPGRASAATEG
jgi:sodium transport system permease protein